MTEAFKLQGRIFLEFKIELKTGLHIGGSSGGLEIGGIDNAIIRDPLSRRPYIPGSSLRGKMRSQLEKVLGLAQNSSIGEKVNIHSCKKESEYIANGGCPVCHIFGLTGEVEAGGPTRLVVRDVPLDIKSDEGKAAWKDTRLDLFYSELKTEVAIDRVTSAATPRTLERVPAGAIFGPAELVFSIYEAADFVRLGYVLQAMQLVEDDYLGGYGSRGSGKICFNKIELKSRSSIDYSVEKTFTRVFDTVQELSSSLAEMNSWAQAQIPVR
jgi:CRISPR-associated protein Csm3